MGDGPWTRQEVKDHLDSNRDADPDRRQAEADMIGRIVDERGFRDDEQD